MKNKVPKTLIKQAYSDPFYLGTGKREERPFYNPFIDFIYLPFPVDSELSLNKKWEFNLEYSHYRFALEMSRFSLKFVLGLVYKGIHDHLTHPDTPPLTVPTFRNAPAVADLYIELMRIYQEFEPIEEVLTLAMEVSLLSNKERHDSRGYSYFMSYQEQASTIEREGLYSIKKNFSPYFVKAYYDIMELTGGDPGAIYLFGSHVLSLQLGPLLIFKGKEEDYFESGDLTEIGRKFRQVHDIVAEDGLKRKFYPEKWYCNKLLTPKGLKKLWQFYLNSKYAPEAQFFHYIDSLKLKKKKLGKKSSSFDQVELRKIMNQAFHPITSHKIRTFLWFVHSAYVAERPDINKFEHVLDRTYFRANQMLDQKTVGILLEHKKFFGKSSDLTESESLSLIQKACHNMTDNYFSNEFLKGEEMPGSNDKNAHSLIFFHKGGKNWPEGLLEKYKDLITWESIRQQFFYLTDLEEFELPWEDEETKELEAFIKENIKIDYVGMNRAMSQMKKEAKGNE